MEEILLSKLTKGFFVPKNDCKINFVTQDSRQIVKNSIFLAIQGERVNGEDYAKTALENGAQLVISENDIKDIDKDKLCIVENVLDANILMAQNYIENYDVKIIAITGSVGKTTTKDFIFSAVSPFEKTIKSVGNNNNELGLPKTVYNLTQEDKIAVLEMGMTQLNDISKLSLATKPFVSVITNIGISHIEHLKTQENILKAKLEITHGMDKEGILILNKDDELLKKANIEDVKNIFYYAVKDTSADVYAKDIKTDNLTTSFTIVDKEGQYPCIIPTVGEHNVLNSLCAYLVGKSLGYDKYKVIENLKSYTASGMRQKIVNKNDIIFIEDCYNASPESMKAGLSTLTTIAKNRTIAVLGDMLELGEKSDELHYEIGQFAKNKNVDILLCFGQSAKFIKEGYGINARHFDKKEDLAEYLSEIIKENDTIIFKASRGMAFEDIINIVYKNQEKL